MTVQTLTKKQEEMHENRENAEKLGLTKQKPVLEPFYDGVADVEGYLSSKPKIMWLLKEPWGEFTPAGRIKGELDFTYHFLKDDVWKDELMWQVIIQINYAIRNNLKWKELDFIADNKEMADEIKKTAYINLSKMPAKTISEDSHLKECYPLWKDIVLEQIKMYEPNIIIFGYTFEFFKDDLQITSKPIFQTTSGKWNAHTYQKNNMILIDAYHPSRKGGECGSEDYVTAVVKAARKAMEQ